MSAIRCKIILCDDSAQSMAGSLADPEIQRELEKRPEVLAVVAEGLDAAHRGLEQLTVDKRVGGGG